MLIQNEDTYNSAEDSNDGSRPANKFIWKQQH